MSIRRYNPFDDMEQLFERVSRQFEDAARRFGDDEDGFLSSASMAVDLVERDDEFVVTIDLPGFDRDEVDVSVSDRTLHVEAEHEETSEEESGSYLHCERRHAATRRSLRLPADIDSEAASATMKHGVLTLTLPKAEADEARTIDIE